MIPEIKRFRLKDGVTIDSIKSIKGIRDGGSWINEHSAYFISRDITPRGDKNSEVSVEIGFPLDLKEWNDFDCILVLDEEFCQPYTPFYNYMSGQIKKDSRFAFLEKVVTRYNEEVCRLDILEQIETEE